VIDWAQRAGIPFRTAADVTVDPDIPDRAAHLDAHPERFDPRQNPSVDYGRLVERIPSLVLSPRDRGELATCVTALAGVDYRVRGTGHSSSGRTLGDVVVETRGLDRILDDRGDAITVEGGVLWQTLADRLAADGRRPLVLTDNLRTTVAGTLAVGGFGDATLIDGVQAAQVERLTLLTPDGALRSLGPGDELFAYALCGRGALGVIVDVTLPVRRASRTLAARVLGWRRLDDFFRDAVAVAAVRGWDYCRGRLLWRGGGTVVEAVVGRLDDRPGDPTSLLVSPDRASPVERLDLHDVITRSQTELDGLTCAVPALEIALPLAAWPAIQARVEVLGLPALMPRGAAIMVVPAAPGLPWAPLPPGEPYSLLVALRPRVSPAEGRALLPGLTAIADEVIALGGRIYLMSAPEMTKRRLEQQLGPAFARMTELLESVSPRASR
jgi:FAD binding domain